MDILRSVALFVIAAAAEIVRAWLIWQGVREQRGVAFVDVDVDVDVRLQRRPAIGDR